MWTSESLGCQYATQGMSSCFNAVNGLFFGGLSHSIQAAECSELSHCNSVTDPVSCCPEEISAGLLWPL